MALIFAPIAINAQSESKNFITFEPMFSVSVINYKYGKNEFSQFGTYNKNAPKSIGGKIGLTMPKHYCGIAFQYNYLPKVKTGSDYNFNALAPNDPF